MEILLLNLLSFEMANSYPLLRNIFKENLEKQELLVVIREL